MSDALLSRANTFIVDPAHDKFRLLVEIAKRAAGNLKIKPGRISGPLVAREHAGSTAVGNGIAIPHAAVEGLVSSTAILARLSRPMEFDSPNGKAVDIVVVLLVPPGPPDVQVRDLSRLVVKLRNREMVARLRAASDADAILATFADASSRCETSDLPRLPP